MPLLPIWENNKESVLSMTLQQAVSTAGDGVLKDNSECSKEIREFFSYVDIDKLNDYIDQ